MMGSRTVELSMVVTDRLTLAGTIEQSLGEMEKLSGGTSFLSLRSNMSSLIINLSQLHFCSHYAVLQNQNSLFSLFSLIYCGGGLRCTFHVSVVFSAPLDYSTAPRGVQLPLSLAVFTTGLRTP